MFSKTFFVAEATVGHFEIVSHVFKNIFVAEASVGHFENVSCFQKHFLSQKLL